MPSLTDVLLLGLAVAASGVSARSAGCGKQPPSSGTKSISNRQYILQVPANYDPSREYKLIFGLHWLGGNMNNVAPGYYGLRALAGESAIFVAPNGLNAGWGNEGGADVRFIDQILAQVQNELCVDETQIFSTGFSFGGAMSSALACARPDVFRAVSVIAGGPMSGCDGGNKPVAYLGIHGTADSVVPVSWGRDLRDRFLRNNGCQSKNAPEPGPGGPRIKTEYTCQPEYPVTWIAHNGDHVAEHFEGGSNWMATETWKFFTEVVGDNGGNPNPNPSPSPNPTTSSTTPPTNPTPPAGGNCSARWGQCGGQGWNGPTCCQSGSSCREQNPWYSQCL